MSMFFFRQFPDTSGDISILGIALERLVVLVATSLITIWVLRSWALPKPIPGIPYRRRATHGILGDLPDMLRATANTDKTYMQWIQEQMQEMNSPIVQMFIRPLSRPVLVLADFRESQDILMRRSKEWDRSDMLAELLKGLLPGHHLVQRTNHVWKSHRRLLQDLMSPSFLHNVAAPAIYNSASILISLWEAKVQLVGAQPFSAQDDIYMAALDAVHAFAFGEKFEHNATRCKLESLNDLGPEAIANMQKTNATKGVGKAAEFPEIDLHPVIAATLDLTTAVERLQGSPLMGLTWKLMELTPTMRRSKSIKDNHILRELQRAVDHLTISDQQKQGDSGDKRQPVRSAVDHMVQREKQIAEKENRAPQYFSQAMMIETFGFVIGGHETTSTTMLWGLKALADNQDSQEKLRHSLQASFAAARSENRAPSIKEITSTEIPYLDAVIEEILRHGATSPAIDRQAMVDTQVLGHHVPKGTIILMLTQAQSMRSPGFDIDESCRSQTCQTAKQQGKHRTQWDPLDMNLFKPERWLVPAPAQPSSEKEDSADAEYRFDSAAGPMLGFGLGLRGCFGRRLAYLELRILITLIVWNFELQPCPKELSTYSVQMGVTSRPKLCYVSLRKVECA